MDYFDSEDSTPFLDLLQNMVIAVLVLFVLAFLLMNPKQETKKVLESKAEFIITITWEKESDDDVDGYLQDPLGNILYYQAREIGVMHLDRDDLGKKNDKVYLPNGKVMQIEDNREIITLRGVLAGEYTLNVHMFNKKDPNPTVVTVTVDKINPFRTVSTKEITLYASGDERTVCRFTLNDAGDVLDVNDLNKSLLNYDDHYNNEGYDEE